MARLNLPKIKSWLQRAVEWPADTRLVDVDLSRMWVGGSGRITFELALDLVHNHDRANYALQGGLGLPRESKPQRTRVRLSRHGLKGLRLSSDELAVWCCTPDRDRKLPWVRRLLDEDYLTQMLAETAAAPLLGLDHREPKVAARLRATIVHYRARKRCVLRVRPIGRPQASGVYLKVFRHALKADRLELLQRLARHLETRSGRRVRIPTLLAYLPTQRLLLSEGIGGTGSQFGSSLEDIRDAAAALVFVHDAPADPAARPHSPADEYQTACRWLKALGLAFDCSYPSLARLVGEIERLLPTIDAREKTLLHGDFSSDNLLRGGDALWLVDFDSLCQGHVEHDVATFLAHMMFDRVVAGASFRQATELAASFGDHYRSHGGRISNDRLQFYLPCAMARLGAIRLTRGISPAVVEGFWGLANNITKRDCTLS